MKVLVLGGGGREHALAWALRRSAAVSEVYCAPGNAGIEGAATCLPLSPNKPAEILRFLNEKEIGLTVIGPEAPLVDGLADALRAGAAWCSVPTPPPPASREAKFSPRSSCAPTACRPRISACS